MIALSTPPSISPARTERRTHSLGTWNLVEQADILRFFQEAIAFHKCHYHPALNRRRGF